MLRRDRRALISGMFFFFKQKTAYELRISDWSSDVCSSDLALTGKDASAATREAFRQRFFDGHLSDKEIELELDVTPQMPFEIPGGGSVGMINLSDMMGKAFGGGQKKRRKLTVASAWEKLDRKSKSLNSSH